MDIKLNLTQLAHVRRKMKNKDGKEIDVLIIPIKKNQLFVGEKGVYFDLQAWALKSIDQEKKQTHIIKQKFAKEVYDKFTEDQKKAIPIMGSGLDWSKITPQEPEPNALPTAEIPSSGDEDDLPF